MISAEGVTPLVGACGTGKEEDSVVGCRLPDHIDEAAQQEEGSPARRRRCKKKGRRRGGGAARKRVIGEEAELPVSNSEGLNLESKEEQCKCGFGWEGGGREIDISAVAEKFHLMPRETGAQVWFKRGRWTVDDEVSCVSQTGWCAKIFYEYCIPHDSC